MGAGGEHAGHRENRRAVTHPPRRYLPRHRIGLLAPSANPAVEPEMQALLPSGVALHTTRLPVMPNTTLEQRNAVYLEAAEQALGSFGALALDVFVLGLTGPSYALAPAEDQALQERLSAGAGKPVVLASRAIAEAVAALGRHRLLLFSPYPGWLTERAERYWQAAGLELCESFKLSDTFRAYELTPEEVADGLARLAPPADSIVLISGTGAPTLDAMAWMGARVGVPVLSSNLCCAFAALRRLGAAPGDALRECCPSLAALLA